MKFNHFKSPFEVDTKQTIVAPAKSGAHPHRHTPTDVHTHLQTST